MEFNKLIDENRALHEKHNNLLEQLRLWISDLAKELVKKRLPNAKLVLKAGMMKYGIWDKIGSKIMDDPDPQQRPAPAPERTRAPTRARNDHEKDY